MINVGIVGGSGYTGAELIRWLLAHPHVNIVSATSRSYVDVRIDKVYPNLSGTGDICYSALDINQLRQCDVVRSRGLGDVYKRQEPS